MRFHLIFLVGIISFFISKTKAQNSSNWLVENTTEIMTQEGFDFSEIKKVLENKRIVAIGESSHGLGEFYRLKSALVEYLHKELGFEVLAMEGGLGDINLAFSNIDTLTFKQLRDETVFGNFRASEANPIFEYIKEQSKTRHKLYFTGYDTQTSSSYFVNMLKPIIETYHKNLADSLEYKLGGYSASYRAGNEGDSIGYYKYQKIFLEAVKEAETILIKNKQKVNLEHQLSEFQYNILLRSLRMFQSSYNRSFQDRYYSIGVRDELMAENIKWLMDSIYPNKKFIVWAHNAHIEKGAVENSWGIKWMGHYLKEWYPNDYYALGLFAFKGNTYQHWTKEVVAFENNGENSIERKMIETGKKAPFLPIENQISNPNNQWLYQPLTGFELENGGTINFIPSKRFDGIITIEFSDIPTYSEN
ncbi:MAG: erythromycin esterase family protein [Flavobacteriaceae bacterium]